MTYIVSGEALNYTHSLVIYIGFTHVAASNTATDYVTN